MVHASCCSAQTNHQLISSSSVKQTTSTRNLLSKYIYCALRSRHKQRSPTPLALQNGQALYDKIIAVSEADEKQETETDSKKEVEKAKKSKNKHSYSGEHLHYYW